MKVSLYLSTLSLVALMHGEVYADRDPRVLAVTTRLTNSVTKVLRQAGCDVGWLSKVLIDSRIRPSEMGRLPPGREIVLFARSCKVTPPPYVSEISARLLAPAARRSAVSPAKPREGIEISILRRRSAALEEKLKAAEREKSALEERRNKDIAALAEEMKKRSGIEENLRVRLANSMREASAAKAAAWRFPGLWPLVLAALAGFVAGLAAIAFLLLWRSKNTVTLRTKRKVMEGGETAIFNLTGVTESFTGSMRFTSKYQCAKCLENDIPGTDKDLRHHVREICRRKRVSVNVHPDLENGPSGHAL